MVGGKDEGDNGDGPCHGSHRVIVEVDQAPGRIARRQNAPGERQRTGQPQETLFGGHRHPGQTRADFRR